MIVHKFGGTSVGDAERFSGVADIITAQSEPAVVVVSAMSGVTNLLISGARAAAEGQDTIYRDVKARLLERHFAVVETLLGPNGAQREISGVIEDHLHELGQLYRSIAVLGELTVRAGDTVTAFGEQLSSKLLAAVLRARGARARACSATELIVTDDTFGAATPLVELTRARLQRRLAPLLDGGIIPVVTGYIAATQRGVTTTLGRGGSDYTAAIVGAGLDADEVWIWSDVDGILTADPNIVPQARTLTELSYAEASALAYFGADVLHPKTIRPVIERKIPLRILNSHNPAHPGTLIVESPSDDREHVPSIISTTGLSLIVIGSTNDAWTLDMAARALKALTQAGVDVLMFSQSFSEHNLNLIVREQDQTHCLHVLRREFDEILSSSVGECPYRLETKERVATISVVGVPGWNEKGTVACAFAALGERGSRIIAVAQAATEHSVSFCIPEDEVQSLVRFLHTALHLD